jgi:hypothetical protein
MNDFKYSKVLNDNGTFYLVNEITNNGIELTKREAYIAKALIQTSDKQKALNSLKENHSNFKWTMEDLEDICTRFKGYLNGSEKVNKYLAKPFDIKIVGPVFILLFLSAVILLGLNSGLLLNTNRIFWGVNANFVFLAGFVMYVVISAIYEVHQYAVSKLLSIHSKLSVSFHFPYVNVVVGEEALHVASRAKRMSFYLSSINLALFVLVCLTSVIILWGAGYSSFIYELLVVLFSFIIMKVTIFCRSDFYYALADLFNVKDIHKKSFSWFAKIPEKGKYKINALRAYIALWTVSAFCFMLFLILIVIPIKTRIYVDGVNNAFFGALSLDSNLFLMSVTVLILEFIVDLFTLKGILKNIFR